MAPRSTPVLVAVACLAAMGFREAAAFSPPSPLPRVGARLSQRVGVAAGPGRLSLCARSGPTTEIETKSAEAEESPEAAYLESEERAGRMELYKELFGIRDMPGDSRRFNAKQIATGQKPLFVKRREKAALYDKLFSQGTASCDELRVQTHAIASGKVTKLSQVKGAPEGSMRLGFRPLYD
mmetsp:Transcript_52878/g.129118  ORF Transcript_52878/g.129118 Transcript_52878/m.129118 type:complete len:181 (+) Transcript_52878:250-792(+)